MAKLGDVCNKAASNIAQKDLIGREGPYPIYGASGFITNVDFYQQENPYIAVVKDGAGVGRVIKLPAKSSVIGTMQYIIPHENIDVSYLAYAMENMNLGRYYTGATIPHIYFKDYQKEELPIPSLDEQRRIAAVLDKVTDLIAQRRAQLDKLDLLVKSRFVEMFGDPVDNSRGWDTIKLKDIGTCKNGMNFHTDNFGVKIHCLGVADFKDKSFIEGTSQLAVISLNEMPTEEYLLKNRDIVFVRSNGNKSLVGRSVMVYPGATPTTFSGFCIRFRLQSESLRPIYLLRVLKTDSVRKKLAGRGANIQNLNQKILLELSVPIPPLELQDSFENFEKRIVQLRAPVRQSLNRLEILKISLMQQYFG